MMLKIKKEDEEKFGLECLTKEEKNKWPDCSDNKFSRYIRRSSDTINNYVLEMVSDIAVEASGDLTKRNIFSMFKGNYKGLLNNLIDLYSFKYLKKIKSNGLLKKPIDPMIWILMVESDKNGLETEMGLSFHACLARMICTRKLVLKYRNNKDESVEKELRKRGYLK